MEEEEQLQNVVFVKEPKKSNQENDIPNPNSKKSSTNTKSVSFVQVHRQQHHHEVHGVPHPHEGPPRITKSPSSIIINQPLLPRTVSRHHSQAYRRAGNLSNDRRGTRAWGLGKQPNNNINKKSLQNIFIH